MTGLLWSGLVVSCLIAWLGRHVMPGGAKRARTADPLLAKQVLYQLSYSPRHRCPKPGRFPVCARSSAVLDRWYCLAASRKHADDRSASAWLCLGLPSRGQHSTLMTMAGRP
jgi:hypothetical protein